MLTSAQAHAQFGEPNIIGKGYLVTISLPYPMRVAENPKTQIKTIQCHKLVADSLKAIFNELLLVYGYEKIKELGIDLYGGCFNYRYKTAGKTLSLHSWGIAIDLDPSRNLFKETKKTARFAHPEYKKMIDTFYKHGWESLGREADYDWMHFQIKSVAQIAKK